jgi:hypothetical protein
VRGASASRARLKPAVPWLGGKQSKWPGYQELSVCRALDQAIEGRFSMFSQRLRERLEELQKWLARRLGHPRADRPGAIALCTRYVWRFLRVALVLHMTSWSARQGLFLGRFATRPVFVASFRPCPAQ